jgi:predicted exporter
VGIALQRCLAARRDCDLNARVFDVSHRSLANDPMGIVRSVYERFDLAYPAQAEQAVKQWSEHPAQHRTSVKFTLADFGLDTDQVETAFGDYRTRFGEYF